MTKKDNANQDEAKQKKPKAKMKWQIVLIVIAIAALTGVGISYLFGAYDDTTIIYQKRYAWLNGYDEIKIYQGGNVYCDEEGLGQNAGKEAHWKFLKRLNKDEMAEFQKYLDGGNDGEIKSYVESNIGCFHTKVTSE